MTHTQERVTMAVRMLMAVRQQRQQDLAAVLGIAQPSVSAKLRGRARWSVDDLDKLAEHFGVPLNDLLQPPRAYSPHSGGSAARSLDIQQKRRARTGLVVQLPLPRVSFEQVAA